MPVTKWRRGVLRNELAIGGQEVAIGTPVTIVEACDFAKRGTNGEGARHSEID